MDEILKYEDMPGYLVEKQIEPFRTGYIQGSKLLAREWSSDGYEVYFHIPMIVAQKMDEHELELLKKQIRGWWRTKTNKEAEKILIPA
jgi:hypothetical protein